MRPTVCLHPDYGDGEVPLRSLHALRHGAERLAEASVNRLTQKVGGAARRRAVVLLACILGLDAADKGAIGAIGYDLERSLHIDNAQVGLVVTVSSLVGALATIPVGSLTDRSRRVRLLWVSIVLWVIANWQRPLAVVWISLGEPGPPRSDHRYRRAHGRVAYR